MIKKLSCVFLCLLLCGCSVRRADTAEAPEQPLVSVQLAVAQGAADGLEALCTRYAEQHPGVELSCLRLAGGDGWRSALAAQLRTGNVAGFWAGSQQDITFFASEALAVPGEHTLDGKGIPLSLGVCGIWVNADMLAAVGVPLEQLGSLQGLQDAVHKLEADGRFGLSQTVCGQTSLAPALSLALRDGVPNRALETLLLLTNGVPAENPDQLLTDRKAAFYFGSSRRIQSALQSDVARSLRLVPLPLEGGQLLAADCDWLCVNAGASEPQRQALLDFLDWLPAHTLTPNSTRADNTPNRQQLQAVRGGQAAQPAATPPGWADAFDLQTEQLRLGRLTWDSYAERMHQLWRQRLHLDTGAD